jgi:hypothetical protein
MILLLKICIYKVVFLFLVFNQLIQLIQKDLILVLNKRKFTHVELFSLFFFNLSLKNNTALKPLINMII